MVNPGGMLGSGVDALLREYQTITNNMANMHTAGFKRQVNSFSRHLMQMVHDAPDARPPEGEVLARGTMDFSQGPVSATRRNLDVAIQGRGFLVVQTPQGPLYTRNGALQLDRQGNLVDVQGRIVAGEDGPILVPPGVSESELAIGPDGKVMAGQTQLGRLRIVDFGDRQNELEPVGFNCCKAPKGLTPQPAARAKLSQGFLENSNVKVVEELVDLIAVSRLYEMNMSLLRRQSDNARTILGVANA